LSEFEIYKATSDSSNTSCRMHFAYQKKKERRDVMPSAILQWKVTLASRHKGLQRWMRGLILRYLE
jgi:hypothetical protein